MRLPLQLAGKIMQLVTALRRSAYHIGLLPSIRVDTLVISIGNISAGGVGKTPLALLLAEQLSADLRVAILSRGYRAAAERSSVPTVVSRWGEIGATAQEGGDEPLLLARRLPHCSVISCRSRVAAASCAIALGADVTLLDDGFQHLRLQRDLDIVVVDGLDPWAGGHCLPGGMLRESISSLRYADLIVVNHADRLGEEEWNSLECALQQYSRAPLVGVDAGQVRAIGETGMDVSLEGKRVAAVCGIGRPERFLATIEDCGAVLVDALCSEDHRTPEVETLALYAETCKRKRTELLLCTEKDWVRFASHPAALSSARGLPWAWLRMELSVVRGMPHWIEFLRKVRALNGTIPKLMCTSDRP